jgi:hypothetical protein
MTMIHGFSELKLAETAPLRPVLQDWVMRLPRRQQGVLIMALRGPDGVSKESSSKVILRNLRGCVLNSAREGRPMQLGTEWIDDTFMRTAEISRMGRWHECTKLFLSEIDSFNLHFYQHLMHAAAVCGVHHWDSMVSSNWWQFYEAGVQRLHMKPETKDEIQYRLRDGMRKEEDE